MRVSSDRQALRIFGAKHRLHNSLKSSHESIPSYCYGTGEGEGDRDEREPAASEGAVGVWEAP